MIMTVARRFFLLVSPLLLLVASCATVAPPSDEARRAWGVRQARLASLVAWEVHGRIALRTATEGWQATLVWRHEAERQRIDLTGPLGRGHLRLTQDRFGAELRDDNGSVHRDTSMQQLLHRATGWQLPFEGLPFWILGRPAPAGGAREDIDAAGRLTALRQLGWDIQFLEYTREGEHELPRKIFVTRHAGEDDTLEVRLVIEKWSVKREE